MNYAEKLRNENPEKYKEFLIKRNIYAQARRDGVPASTRSKNAREAYLKAKEKNPQQHFERLKNLSIYRKRKYKTFKEKDPEEYKIWRKEERIKYNMKARGISYAAAENFLKEKAKPKIKIAAIKRIAKIISQEEKDNRRIQTNKMNVVRYYLYRYGIDEDGIQKHREDKKSKKVENLKLKEQKKIIKEKKREEREEKKLKNKRIFRTAEEKKEINRINAYIHYHEVVLPRREAAKESKDPSTLTDQEKTAMEKIQASIYYYVNRDPSLTLTLDEKKKKYDLYKKNQPPRIQRTLLDPNEKKRRSDEKKAEKIKQRALFGPPKRKKSVTKADLEEQRQLRMLEEKYGNTWEYLEG